jgi:hypothetical protein
MKSFLIEGRVFDLIYLYQFLKRLVTPFKKTKAFELGIIDEYGNVLRKRETLETSEEKSAYTLFDTLVFNIKKLLGKIPGGKSTIASFAAALLLLKEEKNREFQILQENDLKLLNQKYSNLSNYISENKQQYSDIIDSVRSYLVESIVEITTADVPTTQEPNPSPKDAKSYKKRNKKSYFDHPDIKLYEDEVVFSVPTSTFLKAKNRNYTEDSEIFEKINKYKELYPNKPIMLRDKSSGMMSLLRR